MNILEDYDKLIHHFSNGKKRNFKFGIDFDEEELDIISTMPQDGHDDRSVGSPMKQQSEFEVFKIDIENKGMQLDGPDFLYERQFANLIKCGILEKSSESAEKDLREFALYFT